jgi:hypothetical protein
MSFRLAVCVLLVSSVLSGCGEGSHAAEVLAAGPCSTPSANDGEQSVAFPHGGNREEVTVLVGEHVTVGWSGCGEHGQVTTSPEDNTGPLFSSDVSVYSSPRPTPSQQPAGPCCQRPPADGVFTIRYLAQMPGTQVLHGTGSAGSDGEIAVTVQSLTPEQGRLVSGVVDSSDLREHPAPAVVYFQPSGVNPTQTITKPTTDGLFSTRLRPGKYTIMATSPAYNDGRASCLLNRPVLVGTEDVSGIKIVCTEK